MEQTPETGKANFFFAVLGGLDAAAISALVWAVVTVLTKYQIGYMAVGVGALVGFSVRWFGRGSGTGFRVLSVALALAGCATGNYLSQVGFYLADSGSSLLDVALSLRLSQVPAVLLESFSPMDILFYALAAFEAWKFAVVPAAAEQGGSAQAGEPSAPQSFLFSYPPKKILAAVLPFLAVLALPVYVAANSSGVYRDVYDSGAPRVEGGLSWNEPEGLWKYWHESGPLMAEITFRKGLLEGPAVYYDESGAVTERKVWKAGFAHGENILYRPDGTVSSRGSCEYDRKTGLWEEYHPNGKVSSSGRMSLDRRDGEWLYYSDSGILLRRENYEGGENAGVWETFSDSGDLFLRREYRDGIEHILYQKDGNRETVANGEGRYVERHENGRIAAEGDVRGGIRSGVWREWYEDGKPRRVYEFRDGREYLKDYYGTDGRRLVADGSGSLSPTLEGGAGVSASYRDGFLDGEVTSFYSTDNPMSIQTYAAGRQNGPYKIYTPDGALFQEGSFADDRQAGTWTWYEEDEAVSSTVEFVDGRKEGVQSFYEGGTLVKEEVYRNGEYVETRIKR